MHLDIIYNGVDIADEVEVINSAIYDNAGGKADSIELTFADTENLWSKWKPVKGDQITVKDDGFSTGIMYIDELIQTSGKFILKARSIKSKSKSKKTRSWENIRFLKLANDIATSNRLTLQTFNIEDYLYERVDQTNETDLEFLNRICIREGYALKITDGKTVIYNERLIESQESILTIYKSDLLGEYYFKNAEDGIKSSCSVRYVDITGQLIQHDYTAYSDVELGELKIFEVVTSKSEAERFAKGYLRNTNKFETVGSCTIKLNKKITAGNVIEISGVGLFDGKYFIESAIHRQTKDRTDLTIRKTLEGY